MHRTLLGAQWNVQRKELRRGFADIREAIVATCAPRFYDSTIYQTYLDVRDNHLDMLQDMAEADLSDAMARYNYYDANNHRTL
jgi:hypothetical protein